MNRTAIAVLTLIVAGWAPLQAQGVRGWVGTTVQMVEIRPLALDTIPRADVTRSDDGTFRFGGRSVTCVLADICTAYLTLPEDRVYAATQDVSLTAWGFGVTGLSFTTLLRGRASLGSDRLWPRSDDEFDVMLGYAQLHRGPLRARVGRQEVRSGLGFPAFDGGFLALSGGDLRVEVYGGRSLARGLREPAREALRGIEDFLVDQGVYLIGGAATWRTWRSAVSARYHREIFRDRSGLVSERGSLDLTTMLSRARLNASMDYDFGFGKVGKSHVTVSLPLDGGRFLLQGTGRRYVPYFDLSTIWGFFRPVAYSEFETRVAFSPGSAFGTWVGGGWRSYEDTETEVILARLTDDGWRANAGFRWQPTDAWSMDGAYRLEWGPGGFLSSMDLSTRLRPWERLSLTASGTAFQQIEEFRLGDGRAFGGGLSFDVLVHDRASLTGGMSVIRHRQEETDTGSPWNQTRGWTSLRIEVGQDPALARRRSR